jgi:hypothetical protein
MLTADGEIYKRLGDWFKDPNQTLMPKPGMDYSAAQLMPYRAFFDQAGKMGLSGTSLDGTKDDHYSCAISCDFVNAPLIAAVQSGIRGHQLVDIAKHHQVNVPSLIETLDSMYVTSYPLYDSSGDEIPISALYIECIKTISHAFPDELSEALQPNGYDDALNSCTILCDNPVHWPSTRLTAHMKAVEEGAPDLQPLDERFFYLNNSSIGYRFIPQDASGPRYDLYLERSGMLNPEVISKKIGDLRLWEDLIQMVRENAFKMHGLLDYCITSPPEHFKPVILSALKNMTMAADSFDGDGVKNYCYLCNLKQGSWLAPLDTDPKLFINLISSDSFEKELSDWSFAGEVTDMVRNTGTLDYWLRDIMSTKPEDLGLSHFRIYRLGKMNLPKQVITPPFAPEQVLTHMLAGLESFVVPNGSKNARNLEGEDQAMKGAIFLAKTLASRYELDYIAFASVSSLGVRVLAEAGLDKRRLPRMNYRDKGILVSAELGL